MRKLIGWLLGAIVVALCGGTVIALLKTFKVFPNNQVLFSYTCSLTTYVVGAPLGYAAWCRSCQDK